VTAPPGGDLVGPRRSPEVVCPADPPGEHTVGGGDRIVGERLQDEEIPAILDCYAARRPTLPDSRW
jgi:hypothetical protein